MKVGELFTRLGMDFSQFDKDEDVAKGRVESLGGSLSGLLKNAFSFSLGLGFFQAVQSGFRSTIGSALSFNVMMQDARVGFTTMLGSAKRARAFLSDMADFAESTPFGFQELLQASQRMMALGFSAEEVRPALTAVGDTMAAAGKGTEGINAVILALAQMRMAGRVNAQDMLQLTNAGVPAWELLAEAIGKSVPEIRKLAEQGKIDGNWAAGAILEGTGKRFAGMMKKMENGWRGTLSAIKDIWQTTVGEMTERLFDQANEWLRGVRDTAKGFREAFRSGGLAYAVEQTLGPDAAAGVRLISDALRGLWGIISAVGGAIAANWGAIGPIVFGVVKAFLAVRIAYALVSGAAYAFSLAQLVMRGALTESTGILGFLSKAIGIYRMQIHQASTAAIGHAGVLNILKTAIQSVNVALGGLLWPLLIVSAIIMGGIAVWNKYSAAIQAAAQKAQMAKIAAQQKAYADSANEAAKGAGAQADAIGKVGDASKKSTQSFDEFHELTGQAGGAAGIHNLTASKPPEQAMPDLTQDWLDSLDAAKPTLAGFWQWIKDGAKDTWDRVKQGAGSLWDGVKEKWASFTGWVGSWAGPVVDGIKTKWGTFTAWAGGIWDSVQEKWLSFAGWVDSWAGPMWDSAKVKWDEFKAWAAGLWDAAKEKWDGFKTWAGGIWDGIAGKWKSAWSSVKGWLNDYMVRPLEDARDFVLGLIEDAKNWGKNLIDNIVSGVKAKISALEGALKNIGKTIKNFLGFESPTKDGPGRTADEWAPNLMRMYSKGILEHVGLVSDAASTVARSFAPMTTQPAIDLAVGSGGGGSSLKDTILEALMQREITAGGNKEMRITLVTDNGEALVDLLVDPMNQKARNLGYAPVFKPAP